MKQVLLAALTLVLPSSSLMAKTLFFSGNLETNANVTACGPGCTLNPATNTIYDYAAGAAVVYDFTVYTTSTIEAITYSYGGGTSLTGVQVAEGGLEPYLSLFDSAGDFLDSPYYATTCPAGAKYVGSNCFDVELNGGTLTPGTYQISISDYANASYAENNGPPATLAAGFDGLGDSGYSKSAPERRFRRQRSPGEPAAHPAGQRLRGQFDLYGKPTPACLLLSGQAPSICVFTKSASFEFVSGPVTLTGYLVNLSQ